MVGLKLDPIDQRSTKRRADLSEDIDSIDDGPGRLVGILRQTEHVRLDLIAHVRRSGRGHNIFSTRYLVKWI